MSQTMIDLLNKLEFTWDGGAERRERQWNVRYNELVEYHAKYGNTRVPERYKPAPYLNAWVNLQRMVSIVFLFIFRRTVVNNFG